jgi:FkbM family methyltransferase
MMAEVIYFIANPAAWLAFLLWPKFSFTSFRIVSSLRRQGIEPKTIIDVGANVGQFAVACAKIFPTSTVHSFEPEPKSLEKLKRNVENLSKVRICPVALGERSGEALFHINSHSHSSSILPLEERHRQAFPEAQEVKTIKVPLSTLDRELKSISMDRPVLLKLDVQGYEPHVLEGASDTLKRVDYVILEASFRPMYVGEKTFVEITAMMEERGFQFLRPLAWLTDPHNGEVLQMDALFGKSSS